MSFPDLRITVISFFCQTFYFANFGRSSLLKAKGDGGEEERELYLILAGYFFFLPTVGFLLNTSKGFSNAVIGKGLSKDLWYLSGVP